MWSSFPHIYRIQDAFKVRSMSQIRATHFSANVPIDHCHQPMLAILKVANLGESGNCQNHRACGKQVDTFVACKLSSCAPSGVG